VGEIYLTGAMNVSGRLDADGKVYGAGSILSELGRVDEQGCVYEGLSLIALGRVERSGVIYSG
jgi:hypothetical protein